MSSVKECYDSLYLVRETLHQVRRLDLVRSVGFPVMVVKPPAVHDFPGDWFLGEVASRQVLRPPEAALPPDGKPGSDCLNVIERTVECPAFSQVAEDVLRNFFGFGDA
ncbi:MAG: hypothetical protein K8U57_21505 [Planctomycetes bacterium]|nr:hypothetical protein [Planctomycetota bacterium]